MPCLPQTTIDDIHLTQFDSIVLPGVDDFKHLADHQGLLSFLKRANDQKRIIGPISSAPYFLSKSGLLANKRYTTGLTFEQRTYLGTFNEDNYLDSNVVIDENIITARGSAFIEFAFGYGDLLKLNYNKKWYVN